MLNQLIRGVISGEIVRRIILTLLALLGFAGAAAAQPKTYTFSGLFTQDLNAGSALGTPSPYSVTLTFDPTNVYPGFPGYSSYAPTAGSITLGSVTSALTFDMPGYQNHFDLQYVGGTKTWLSVESSAHAELVGSAPGVETVFFGFFTKANGLQGLGLPIDGSAYDPATTEAYLLIRNGGSILSYLGNFSGVPGYVGNGSFAPGVLAGPGGGALPEPATWAMMIVGIGAAGYRLRRRRQQVTASRA